MDGNGNGKVVINLATGLEDPERVTVAFLVAGAAATAGKDVTMFLTKEAVRLAVPGVAEGVACEGCPSLPTLATPVRGSRRSPARLSSTASTHASSPRTTSSRPRPDSAAQRRSGSGSVMTARRSSATDLGDTLVAALAERDFDRLAGTLAPDVRMRALIPPGPIELSGAKPAAARFATWFGESDGLELVRSGSDEVGDRLHVFYRLRVKRPGDPWKVIEQHLFCALDEGRIAALDLLCSGFRLDRGHHHVTSTPMARGGREAAPLRG